MAKKVLLLGRLPFVMDELRSQIGEHDAELFTGTNIEDVRVVMADNDIDIVISGAGIDLPARLAIVELVLADSDGTTVHLKDRASGRAGMPAFIDAILGALA